MPARKGEASRTIVCVSNLPWCLLYARTWKHTHTHTLLWESMGDSNRWSERVCWDTKQREAFLLFASCLRGLCLLLQPFCFLKAKSFSLHFQFLYFLCHWSFWFATPDSSYLWVVNDCPMWSCLLKCDGGRQSGRESHSLGSCGRRKVLLTQHSGVKSKSRDLRVMERYKWVFLTTCPASNDASEAQQSLLTAGGLMFKFLPTLE